MLWQQFETKKMMKITKTNGCRCGDWCNNEFQQLKQQWKIPERCVNALQQ
jgi:hypothetical protein